MPAAQQASSSSPVPPLAPAAPMILPDASLISAAPVCGRNLPLAVEARVRKKFGLSFARLPSARLEQPIATAPHALPRATSMRNMLALSSRCADTMLPALSSTTTASGFTFISCALAIAPSMMVLACCKVRPDMVFSVMGGGRAIARHTARDCAWENGIGLYKRGARDVNLRHRR